MEVKNNIIVLVRSGMSALYNPHFSASRHNVKNPFFARDEAVWIQHFQSLALKLEGTI